MPVTMALEARLFDNEPPAYRTSLQNHPTLLVSWWCTGVSFVVILFRLSGRYIRSEQLFAEDKIMAWSIIPLMTRMGLAHVILLWGTNNTMTTGLTSTEIDHASVGARLVLASRIFFALFIWMQKFTISEFLKRLIDSFWNRAYELILKGIRIFLLVTFIAVLIATLAECQPFDHYWQVVPDPGPKCREGLAQVLAMATCDIVTDIVLIAFPIPIILNSAMHWQRKISLCLLFMTSLILIAITSYRAVTIIDKGGLQQVRTLWASIEILAAAAISNGLILGSFVRDRGTKKVKKFKHYGERNASVDHSSINRVMTKQHWGSDEDLFRSVGCRMDSITAYNDDSSDITKAPPLPLPRPREMDQYKLDPLEEGISSDHATSSVVPQNHDRHSVASNLDDMRFFDAGNILEQGPSPPDTSTEGRSPSSTLVDSAYHPADTRNLTSEPRRSSRRRSSRRRRSQSPFTHDSSKRSSCQSHDLQDIGGLLGESSTSASARGNQSAYSRERISPPSSPSTRPKSLIQALRESRVRHSPSLSPVSGKRRSRLGDPPLSNMPTPDIAAYDLQMDLADPGGLLLDDVGPTSHPRAEKTTIDAEKESGWPMRNSSRPKEP